MTTQSPYTILYATTGGGSVAIADCGGLALAGLALTSGGTAVLTLEATPSPASSTYGTLRILQPGVGVGTAATITAATAAPHLLREPLGPIYGLRVTAVGTNLAAGSVALYLRG